MWPIIRRTHRFAVERGVAVQCNIKEEYDIDHVVERVQAGAIDAVVQGVERHLQRDHQHAVDDDCA